MKSDWRDYLRGDEIEDARALEERAAALDQERAGVTDALNRIRNRCIQRKRSK